MYNWLRSIVVVCGGLQLSGCYVLKQAWLQNNLLNARRPVEEVLRDETTPDFVAQGLGFLGEILAFAKRTGLNTAGAYGDYVRVDQSAVSYLVKASDADQFRFKTWWFPFVGTVPYLGFFHQSDRDQQAESLRQQGYDVSTSHVDAFSSLGWFDDPIYTPMLKKRRHRLVLLIFHELVHRTVWIEGSVNFNENLAEFVASKMSNAFFNQRRQSEVIESYQAAKQDRRRFKLWIKDLQMELSAIYSLSIPRDEKLLRKQQTIEQFQKKKLPKFESKAYGFVGRKRWNNASIMGVSLYLPDVERFEKAFACFGGQRSLGAFLQQLKLQVEQVETEKNRAFIALDGFCLS